MLQDKERFSSISQLSTSLFLFKKNEIPNKHPEIAKTISLFSLIVIKKGIFEKRLTSAPVAPIATSNAGKAQQIRVLVL